MDKRDIRRKVSAMRKMLLETEKEASALEVFARLEDTAAFMMADRILMYLTGMDNIRDVIPHPRTVGSAEF